MFEKLLAELENCRTGQINPQALKLCHIMMVRIGSEFPTRFLALRDQVIDLLLDKNDPEYLNTLVKFQELCGLPP